MNFEKPHKKSVKEYARGIIGGLLFSFPMLYTMEVWWTGLTINYPSLLLFVVLTYLVLLGYNRYAGMHPGVNMKNIFMESVEEMGIGILISFIMLFLLNRINMDSGLQEVIGKVVIEAMLVSIGVSVGTAQMEERGNKEETEEEGKKKTHGQSGNKKENVDDSSGGEEETIGQSNGKRRDRRSGKLALVILTICGSLLVSSSVAPTDETWVIAAQSRPYQILLISIISIALTVITSYFSNFRGTERMDLKLNVIDVIFVTSLCYSTSLLVSAFLLWFFGDFSNLSFHQIINGIVIVGAIASLGGSAGRLLIK